MLTTGKRILIATGLFPPQVGGPATYSKLLLDKLPEIGFAVKVESFDRALKYPKIIRHLIYFFRLLRAGAGSDVIYAQDPVSVGLPAWLASTILGKKFYLKIVGDYAWEQGTQRFGVKDLPDEFSVEYSKYPWSVKFLKKVQLFVAERADKILVPSNYLKKIVSNWGINPEKITVVYNAFRAPKNFNPAKFSGSSKTIISAGRLVPWKGFDTLISLMPEIRREIADAHLFIVGDGPDRLRLEERIKELNAQGFVTLLGRLDQQELFARIRSADIFALNTSYEGLSHQLLEVMALETPIVTTTAGGNSEVIIDGENGILISYNDRDALKKSILSILKDRELGLRLVMKGRNRLTRFNEDKMLEETARFLTA